LSPFCPIVSLARRLTGAAHLGVVAAAAMTILSWASAFAGIRAALIAYSPAHLALLRYLIASLVMAVYAIATRMPLPERRDLPRIAVLGLLGFTVYNLGLGYGEITVPAATASFLIASAPVWMALEARAFLRERLAAWAWAGVALSFAGVTVIALAGGDGLRLSLPALLVLAAALSTSFYSLGQKPLLKRYKPLQFTAYAIWAGTFFLLPFVFGLPAQMRAAPPAATLSVVYLGVFPGALGYLGWSYVLAHLPSARAGSLLNLIPMLALLIAWIWLGEAPGWIALLGGILVLGGVLLVNWRRRPAALAHVSGGERRP
jgi:drug/metabolite transporter (DMT)-like permease